MKITAIRGFNDITGTESELFSLIEDVSRKIFSSYGYSEIRLPVVERTELFKRSIGETTDIVEKEMYTFDDRKGDSLTLRPEGTAPVVRAFIENKLYNSSPVTKLHYTGPMFRYERPQKGRYRQFYQIGTEAMGESSAKIDAESLGMLMELFAELKVEDAKLEVNSLGCGECRPGYKKTLLEFLKGIESKLCNNCQRRIDENPLRALDCKNPDCIEATSDAPMIVDSICGDCSEHFSELKTALSDLNVPYTLNARMVRGLDYYTRTTFEVTAGFSGELGSQNSVAAGGRYDGLVKNFGGPDTPCFGFAIGMERLALLLKGTGISNSPALYVLIAMGEEAEKKAAALSGDLRKNGLSVTTEYSGGSLKSRMKRADKMGADFTLILGEDELSKNVIAIRDMKKGEQRELALDIVAGELAS